MNYYEHHIGDYLAAAAHLTLLEHGCYLRLLHVYYRDEAPIAAADACRKVGARSDEERAAVAAILAEFFTLDGEVYRHARCDREIERYRSKQEKARAAAGASVSARRSKAGAAPTASVGSTDAQRTLNGGSTLQTPDTRHQTEASDADASGAAAPDGQGTEPAEPPKPKDPPPSPAPPPPPPSPKDVLFALGVPLLTAAGIADKSARSFLALQAKTHGDEAVARAVEDAAREGPVQPLTWIQARLKPRADPMRGADVVPLDRKGRQLLTAALLTGGASAVATPSHPEAIDVDARVVPELRRLGC